MAHTLEQRPHHVELLIDRSCKPHHALLVKASTSHVCKKALKKFVGSKLAYGLKRSKHLWQRKDLPKSSTSGGIQSVGMIRQVHELIQQIWLAHVCR